MKWVNLLLQFPNPNYSLVPSSFNNPNLHKIPPRKSSPPFNNNITAAAEETEIRVCTNRTCRRQGSMQIHEILSGIAPPNVTVKSCGCLGRCGSGPNLVALPAAVIVTHCGTPARAADFMFELCSHREYAADELQVWECLEALALRKRAEIELAKGNFSEAESLLSKAIHLQPFGGVHLAYKGRSSVRLKNGNFCGALEDAKQATVLAPQYAEAYICQGDAFLAMNQFDKAEESYSVALERDPSIHHSKSFKARITMLQEKLASAAMS
ncbi:hypothetical protein Ancab_012640 [Ancistrocladus abbreviatus]